MRLVLSAAVLLLATAPAFNDDKKPPALTDKEVADGWLMLFDGETTFGWKIDGEAKVKDGVLLLGGGQKATVATPSLGFAAYDMRLETEGVGRLRFKSGNGSSDSALTAQPCVITVSVRPDADSGITHTLSVGPDMVARSELIVTTNGRSTLEI